MDIDFSQVGQNVAAQDKVQNRLGPAPVNNLEPAHAKGNEPDARQDQEFGAAADTNKQQQDNTQLNIEQAVAEVSEFVQTQTRQLSFSMDEESKRAIVKVTDSESGEVIRQIPSEELLALSDRIKTLQTDVGNAVGVLFDNKV